MQASKKDKPESSASETDFDEDEDPDQIEVPGRKSVICPMHTLTFADYFIFFDLLGGGKDLESAKSMKTESSGMETDDMDTTIESESNSNLSSLCSDMSNKMSGDMKPNIQPSANGNAKMQVCCRV